MEVKTAIEKRRAYRALEKTDITSDVIYKLGQAAQLAPSCFNKQPWKFIFISSSDSLNKFHAALSDKNSWAAEASLIIAVISAPPLDCRMKDGREYYLFDTGIACGFIMLQAAEMGLTAHPMAGYDQNKAKDLLKVPSDMTLINLIAVGKHKENYEGMLSETQIELEKKRPERKSLSEIIFINEYGTSFGG